MSEEQQRKRPMYEGDQVARLKRTLFGALNGLTDVHWAAIEKAVMEELRYCRSLAWDEGILIGMKGRFEGAKEEIAKREADFRERYGPHGRAGLPYDAMGEYGKEKA